MNRFRKKLAFSLFCLAFGVAVFFVTYEVVGVVGENTTLKHRHDNIPRIASAIHRDNLGHLRQVLESGEDPNQMTSVGTPLHIAIYSADVTDNTIGIVKLLIEYGADPNRANEIGLTPLHIVANDGGSESEGLTRALLEAGADPDVVTAHPLSGMEYDSPYVTALKEGNGAAAAAIRSRAGHVDPPNLEELEEEGVVTQMIYKLANTRSLEERKRLIHDIVERSYKNDVEVTKEMKKQFKQDLLNSTIKNQP